MAQEHKSNSGTREDGAAPPPKPQATPAELAKLVSQVSALLADLYPQEQMRVLASVKVINGLQDSSTAQRPQQRPPTGNNTNNNNQRRGG